MNEKNNDWINNSQKWQDELERALEKLGDRDDYIEYKKIAFAFPSNDPNPYSFDYPLIDQKRFLHWAESKGWKVRIAKEILVEKNKHHPVHFEKID